MPGGTEDDTGRRRRYSNSDDEDDCLWHDRLVEHFGADGRGGEWGRAMKVLESHAAVLEDLKALKWKLLGMVALGGIVAGILAWLIPQVIGKH